MHSRCQMRILDIRLMIRALKLRSSGPVVVNSFYHTLDNIRWSEGCISENDERNSEVFCCITQDKQDCWIICSAVEWVRLAIMPFGKKAAIVWNMCVCLSPSKKLRWSKRLCTLTFCCPPGRELAVKVPSQSIMPTSLRYGLPYSWFRTANWEKYGTHVPARPWPISCIWSTNINQYQYDIFLQVCCQESQKCLPVHGMN